MEGIYYPAKIWLAFGESVNGNEEILNWLMDNGYPELAALAQAVRGSEQATDWLLSQKYYHLAALDAAIDEDMRAYEWLNRHRHFFLIIFADACRGKPAAIRWFTDRGLEGILNIAVTIKKLRDNTTFDYHRKNF